MGIEDFLPKSPIEGMGNPKYIEVEVDGYGPYATLRISLDLNRLDIGCSDRIESSGNLCTDDGKTATSFVDKLHDYIVFLNDQENLYLKQLEEWKAKAAEQKDLKEGGDVSLNTYTRNSKRLAEACAHAREVIAKVLKEDFRYLSALGFGR